MRQEERDRKTAEHVRDRRQLRRTAGNLQKKKRWLFVDFLWTWENKFDWNLFAHDHRQFSNIYCSALENYDWFEKSSHL